MSLIEKIDQFIIESLRHRYDSRAPQVTFLLNKADSCSDVSNRSGQVKVKLSAPQTFQKFVFRFPQTRIYYSLYQNTQWEIKILEYFNRTIVFYKKRGKAAPVQFQTQEAYSVYSLNPTAREKGNGLDSSGVFWIAPKGENGVKDSAVIAWLQAIRQAEYAFHPLTFFQTSDHTLQKKIDQWFAQVQFTDSAGKLTQEAIHAPGFIWLIEFYLKIGWWERLSEFFKNLKSEIKHTPQLILAARQLNTFLQAINKKPVDVPQDTFQQKKRTFFYRYFLPDEPDETIGKDVQKFWEYLQIPALRLRWEREIALNPDEFIAFVMLAIEQKFWWATQAIDFVRSFLPEAYKLFFNLLTAISSGICLTPKEHAFRISTLNGQREKTLLALPWSVKYYAFGKQNFTELFIHPFALEINLNQYIDFEINLCEKEVRLIPGIFKPPLDLPSWRTILIEFGDIRIRFPLIWQQATLKLNDSRLKFLRKKKRFQITVKNTKNQGPIKINGQLIEMRPDRFAKFYLPVEKKASRTAIRPFTPTGCRLTTLSLGNNAFTLRGVAFDSFGILKERFRVSFNALRSNKGIETNALPPEVLRAPYVPISLKITAGKCDPVHLELLPADGFWQALKNTPPERLIHEVKIWIDRDEREISVSEVAALSLKRLGWFPKIEEVTLDNFVPGNETFNLLLSSTGRLKDEIVIDAGNIKLFKSNTKLKLKYLQINPIILTKLFDIEFFIQEFEKK